MSAAPTLPRPLRRARDPARPGRWAPAREQLAAAGGQVGAGVGNLVFTLVAVRLLAPDAFAQLAAFLALYLLLHVPAGSLAAAGALAPHRVAGARRRVLSGGVGVGAALALTAVPLASLLNVGVALLLILALAAPTAGLIELERGRLYGSDGRRRVVASLLTEPAVRLTVGLALAATVGAVGAAAGVVAAGWLSLAVLRTGAGRHAAAPARGRLDGTRSAAAPAAMAGAFLGLALVQNGGVLLASALLDAGEAARFAVLATLGGVAAFASTTVPLVLLGRGASEGGRSSPLAAALITAGALGGGAVVIVAAAPELVVTTLFGERYAAVAPLAAPYVLAMALLGLARVLVAHRVAAERWGQATVGLVLAVGALVVLAVALGGGAGGVALATLVATALLTASVAAPSLPSAGLRGSARDARQRAAQRMRDALASPAVRAVIALTLLALALRLAITRGIWLDEATSIFQAGLPFGRMLEVLGASDVHPPLHHAILWVTVRLLGDGELAVRLPSVLLGTALVPALYAAGHELWDRRTGLAAAALGAVAPLVVWYSQEARMYALVMLLMVVAVWGQARVLRRGGAGDWAIYTVATVGLLYSHYSTILPVLVQQAFFLTAVLRRRREGGAKRLTVGWIASLDVIVILALPLVGFGLDQFAVNEGSGRGFEQPSQAGAGVGGRDDPAVYTGLTSLVWGIWGYHSQTTMAALGSLWPLLILLVLALLGRGRSRAGTLLAALVIVPVGGMFALGLAKPFLFELRYFIGAVPLALLLGAHGLVTWARRPAVRALAVGVAVATMLVGLVDQQVNGANPRTYDFDGALARIESEARPGDRVFYAPSYLNNIVGYYTPQLGARPLPQETPRVPEGGRLFLLASFLENPPTAEAVGTAVSRLGEREELVGRFSEPQIEVWVFE